MRLTDERLIAIPPLLDELVFHCQQAAEKALKGLPTWHDLLFRPRSHFAVAQECHYETKDSVHVSVRKTSEELCTPSSPVQAF